jgi:hypothetical protein
VNSVDHGKKKKRHSHGLDELNHPFGDFRKEGGDRSGKWTCHEAQ